MGALIFKAAEVRRVVEHALASTQFRSKWDWTANKSVPGTRPEVCLVHDDGVYLMSNGEPRDLDERHSGPSEKAFVAQAAGCDPKTDPDWWETSRRLVGGDDFGEYLPWAEVLLTHLDGGAETIQINVTEGNIELVDPTKAGKRGIR